MSRFNPESFLTALYEAADIDHKINVITQFRQGGPFDLSVETPQEVEERPISILPTIEFSEEGLNKLASDLTLDVSIVKPVV